MPIVLHPKYKALTTKHILISKCHKPCGINTVFVFWWGTHLEWWPSHHKSRISTEISGHLMPNHLMPNRRLEQKTCSNCFNSIFATVGVNNLAKFNIVWHHYNPSKVAKPCTMEMLAFNALRHVTCSAQNYAHIGDHWIMGQLSHVHCNRNLITIEFQINKKSMSKLYGWIVLKCPHVP